LGELGEQLRHLAEVVRLLHVVVESYFLNAQHKLQLPLTPNLLVLLDVVLNLDEVGQALDVEPLLLKISLLLILDQPLVEVVLLQGVGHGQTLRLNCVLNFRDVRILRREGQPIVLLSMLPCHVSFFDLRQGYFTKDEDSKIDPEISEEGCHHHIDLVRAVDRIKDRVSLDRVEHSEHSTGD